jgi:hypothetical protein
MEVMARPRAPLGPSLVPGGTSFGEGPVRRSGEPARENGVSSPGSVIAAQDETAIREQLPQPTLAERQVADLLPIGADEDTARAVLDRIPLWFHTFSLD